MITRGVDFYQLHDACKEKIQQLKSVISWERRTEGQEGEVWSSMA